MFHRRNFLGVAAVVLATPAIVRVGSLGILPPRRFFAALDEGTNTYDITDGQDRLVGWISRQDLETYQPSTTTEILRIAGEGWVPKHQALYEANRAAGVYEYTVPLKELVRIANGA